MSVEQYQRTVNSLDKEIADLEKKKAAADKKAADESKKAANVTISKNATPATIKSKMSEIERYKNASTKAATESADYGKKIADKRAKRNEAYLKLQKEQEKEQKNQQKALNDLQRKYESRIAELVVASRPNTISSNNESYDEEYDVFISHAWEDKEKFVDRLVDEMKKAGITVWYDTAQLRWGDSMRQRIDDGLRKSKFGVVVLSPDYIADGKYWTQAELNGLFQKESINGKVLLPIWYNLNKEDVVNFSVMIADKKALKTSDMTAKEIAVELAHLLGKNMEET